MILKSNLHFHCADDAIDELPYSFYEGIDAAKRNGFHVVALTCHNICATKPEYTAYAAKHGILLIPGIEQSVEGRHVVILNPHESVTTITSFDKLRSYRAVHKESFIIAPHPYFPGGYSLQHRLKEYMNCFDAIEHSWFYTRFLNLNRRAQQDALRYQLPFIATGDTHELRFLNTSYAMITTGEKTIESVFSAIRRNNFLNVTSPRTIGEMLSAQQVRELATKIKIWIAKRLESKSKLSPIPQTLTPIPVEIEE